MNIFRRILVFLIFIPPLFAILVGYLENGKFLVVAAAAALLLLAALEYIVLKRKTSPLARAALIAFVGVLSIYTSNLTKNCSQIAGQQGVRPLLLFGGACRYDTAAPCAPELNDPYDIVLTESKEIFVVNQSGLTRIPLDNPAAYKTRYVPAAHCVDYIPQTNQVVAPGFDNHRITFVNAATLKVERIEFCKNKNFIGVNYNETLRAVYALPEKNALSIVRLGGEKPLDIPKPFLRPAGLFYAIRVSAPLNRMFITSWAGGFVYSVPLGDFGAYRRAFHPPGTTGVAVDEAGRRLFAALYFRSWILVLDPETLEVRRKIRGGFGVRDLEYVPERDQLLAANDLDGTVDVIDVGTGARRSRTVGPRARGLAWDAENEKIYACSLCGVFEVYP